MRIEFEIEEDFSALLRGVEEQDNTILRDGKWYRGDIKDENYYAFADVDFGKHYIEITTQWSKFEYTIYKHGDKTMCSYVGAYRGFLEQNLMLKITPRFTGDEIVYSTRGRYCLERYIESREDVDRLLIN